MHKISWNSESVAGEQKKKTYPKPQQIEKWGPQKYYCIWKINESRTVVKTLSYGERQTANGNCVLWKIMKLTVLCDFKSNENEEKKTQNERLSSFFSSDVRYIRCNNELRCVMRVWKIWIHLSVNSHSEQGKRRWELRAVQNFHRKKWNKHCKELSQFGISAEGNICYGIFSFLSLWCPSLRL